MFRQDPGPCLVCGRAHSACTAGDHAAIEIAQLPQRDAAAARAAGQAPPPALVADTVQATLPPGQFTSATYRGDRKRVRR